MKQEPKRPGRKPGRRCTEQLRVMLTPEEMAALVGKALAAGMTYSDLVRAAVSDYRPRKPKEPTDA